MATSFNVNIADLAFILRQIKVAEMHAAGTPLIDVIMSEFGTTAANAAQMPVGLRTVDGTYNNLVSEATKDIGAADTLFPRLTDPVYRNEGDEAPFFGVTNTNYGVAGNVVDSDPRIISNLIVDMSVANPAAIDAWFNNPLSLASFEEAHPGMIPLRPGDAMVPNGLYLTNTDLQTIPNQSPDIGLSPGFNSWMTFFGQFFDHGLDLVTKGQNGTVLVPLAADDPLIPGADGILGNTDDLPPQLRFMALTRATPTMVDPDGAGPLPAVAQHENTTTSWVDQNQTYTSHASHQVFLREYVRADIDGAGAGTTKTYATGRLLDGQTANGSLDGAIGNWAEVKAQALTMLGIRLNDFDLHNVPLLATDQYGKFIPGANGYAQIVMAPDATHATNWLQEGTAAGITTAGSIGTNHAFLNDIAHHAAPGFFDHDNNPATAAIQQTADTLAGVADDGLASTYDDEMLNAHFITGDGRGNENIALTTVHSIFHSEHNRLVDANKATILASGDKAFINEWLLIDIAPAAAIPTDPSTLVWDGERLFQAARFGTEMQYQHMVFEEFARRIQPMVDPFIFNTLPEIDPSIVAEFAHTVYRFGHSMLTGTVDRLDNNLNLLNGDLDQQTLLAVFLNPQAYLGSGADIATINANIIRGLSLDVGNEIDELIVTDVRSNLLGLPLDLGALNISRGRDTGIPSLNQTRAQLYNDTGLADLIPYTSWQDFALSIKNPASLVNFIAAYGTHATIEAAATLADKRAAAEALVFGGTGAPADRLAFLNGSDAYDGGAAAGAAGSLGGLNKVDLWIGGLAEAKNEFGGMLGSTFNFVFEKQMEDLQFGDRMYYLSRTQGLNFLNQLEPNTFSDIVMRNTALGDVYATHLNGALFVTPDHILELDRQIAQTDYDPGAGIDPLYAPGEPHPILSPLKVTRDYTGSTTDVNGHDVGGTMKFIGGEHVVLGGTEGNDKLYGDRGIDTLWGDGGNDYLNAGTESDDVFGGEGDDIIEDPFGDDVLRGGQGNDVVSSARGLDLMFGDQGADFIQLGQDASEAFGGADGDFILGGSGQDFLLGNEGNDWMEGGAGFDTLAGDNSELFFNSPLVGHDVMFNQGDEGDYDAESGDDIMGSGSSVFRYEGMFGFDWGIGKGDTGAVRFDLAIPIFTTIPNDILRDRFDQVEALSGYTFNDELDGDERGQVLGVSAPGPIPVALFTDHVLDAAGIDRIDGLRAWFGSGLATLFGPGATTFRDGNLLMGGDGNDFMRGRGGYDILDGDAWLNVRIKIVVPTGPNAGTYSAESLNSDTSAAGQFAGRVFNTNPDGSANFASLAFGGRALTALMLDGTINPGQLSIVREVLYDTTPNNNTDTAIFRGTLAEYVIEGRNLAQGIRAADTNGDGFISVRDLDNGILGPNGVTTRDLFVDNTDLLRNIEQLQFSDQTIAIAGTNRVATGLVTISDPTPLAGAVSPYVGQVLTATVANVVDLDGYAGSPGTPTGMTIQWQIAPTLLGAGWATVATGATYTVRPLDIGNQIRAVAVFKDNAGVSEQLFSAPTAEPTTPFSVNENKLTNTPVGTLPRFDPTIVTETLYMATGADAGGRFKVVQTGTDLTGQPIFELQVANGGPANLDYEVQDAFQIVDNQYQVVVDSYTDTKANGGTVFASRQFTIFLNNVEPEVFGLAPTDIQWNGVTPAISALPGAATAIATLTTVDPENATPFQYSLVAGSSLNFTVDAATGVVTRTGTPMAANTTYTVTVKSTDATDASRTESFTIRTGSDAGNVLNQAASTNDVILYGDDGNDILTGGSGNDTLFGQDENDTLVGNGGNDVLVGATGTDTLNGGLGNDTYRFGLTDGTDTVNETGGTADRVVIATGGAALTALAMFDDNTGPTNGNLTIDFNGQRVTLTDHYDNTNESIELINFDNGSFAGYQFGAGDYLISTPDPVVPPGTVTILSAGTNNLVVGETGNETFTGNTGNDLFFGAGGIDTLNGNGGNDLLVGGAGNDILSGGAGNDVLVGGADNDAMNGGLDDDTYTIGLTDGNDTIVEAGGAADRIVIQANGAALTFLEIRDLNAGTAAGDLLVFYNTNQLTATNHFAGGANAIELINFNNATFTGYQLGAGDYTISSSDPADSGAPAARTVTVAAGNNVIGGEAGADRFIGGTGNDLLFGFGGNDILTGGGGNDLLVGGAANDTLNGDAGNDTLNGNGDNDTLNGGANNDTFNYVIGDGVDTVNGGTETDTLAISAAAGNQTLAVTLVGGVITGFEGGTVVGVEAVTANLGTGTDTLVFTSATAVTVNLGTGAATGFTSIAGIENVTGGAGADMLIGDGANNFLIGGAGGDVLIGGIGQDTINMDAAAVFFNDNVVDVVRFVAATEYGDVINMFDATGTAAQADRVEFAGALNTLLDDGVADDNIAFISGNGVDNDNVAVNVNTTNEALFLSGAAGEGVTNANLTVAAAIAAEFNAEFALTATNGETTLLVINDTTNNSASMWSWLQAGGGEIAAAELTYIGIVNGNGTVTTANFDFIV